MTKPEVRRRFQRTGINDDAGRSGADDARSTPTPYELSGLVDDYAITDYVERAARARASQCLSAGVLDERTRRILSTLMKTGPDTLDHTA